MDCHGRKSPEDSLEYCFKKKAMTRIFCAPNPHIIEVAKVIGDGIRQYFCHLTINVIDCPNLTNKPFYLPRAGLCGENAILNVGSIDYLLPHSNPEKFYDLRQIFVYSGLRKGQMFGGGTGPYNGCASELTALLAVEYADVTCNRSVRGCASENKSCAQLTPATDTCLSTWGQLFCTEGNLGKVIEIHAVGHIGSTSLGTMLHEALHRCYGKCNQPIALGLVFCLENSGAIASVLSDIPSDKFSIYPNLEEHVSKIEIPGPIVGMGTIFSHDPKDMDLMLQHINCFDVCRTMTGRFENEINPECASYKIYLVPVQRWGRIDKPVY